MVVVTSSWFTGPYVFNVTYNYMNADINNSVAVLIAIGGFWLVLWLVGRMFK